MVGVGGIWRSVGRSSLSRFSPVNRRKLKVDRKMGDTQVMQMMAGGREWRLTRTKHVSVMRLQGAPYFMRLFGTVLSVA